MDLQRQHTIGQRLRGAGRAGRWLGALAGAVLAATVLAACSAPPRGNLRYLEPESYRIENPSADRALVTGKACAFAVHEAEQRAQEIANFNLRRLTGDAPYRIEFSRLSETTEGNQVCVEMQAQAIPHRFR
jgi:hypothetical protein